jgi:hypothetical protein
MKNFFGDLRGLLVLAAIFAVLTMLSLGQQGGGFILDQWATPSSGGQVAGGVFTMDTTIGELAVTRSTGGQYRFASGFDASTTGVCTDIPLNQAAWYRAENNVSDADGLLTGALLNGAGFSASGRVGNAFNLPVNVGASVFTPRLVLGDSYTVEMWINPSASQGQTTRIFAHHAGLPGFGSFDITSAFGLQYRHLNVIRASTPAGIVPANTWSHVAVTRSAADNFTRIYLNGTLVATSDAFPARYDNVGIIGGAEDSTGSNFNGRIDEVGLYNRELSASELGSIFLAGTAGKCDPPFKVIPRARTLFTNGQLLLSTLGGTPTVTFSLLTNNGGTIDTASGLYTAGPDVGGDVILATDGKGQTAQAATVTLAPVCVSGQKTWDGGGTTDNWSEPANWTCDQVPTSTENVFFTGLTSKNAVIDTPTTVRTIRIETGYKGTISQSEVFTLNGSASESLQADGNFICGGPTVSFSSTFFVLNGGTFNCGSSDLSFPGNSRLTINGGTFVAPSGTMTLNANLLVNGGVFDSNSGTVVFTGNQQLSVNRIGNSISFNNLVLNTIQFIIPDFPAVPTAIVEGSFSYNSGTFIGGRVDTRGALNIAPSVTGGSGAIAITGDAARNVTLPAGAQLPNLHLNAPNVNVGTTGTDRIIIRGMTLSQGIFDSGIGTLQIGIGGTFQTYTQSGGTFVCGGGLIETGALNLTLNGGVFDCSASPSLTSLDGFLNIVVNGGTFTSPSQTIQWGTTLQQSNNASLQVGASGTFLHPTGNLNIRSFHFLFSVANLNVTVNDVLINSNSPAGLGANTLRANNVNILTGGIQNGTLDIRGNFSAATAVASGLSASLTFSGGNAQTFLNTTGQPLSGQFITVNKSANTLTLLSDFIAPGSQFIDIILTNGTITTGTFKVDAGQRRITQTNGYITGNLRREFISTGSRLFPVGTANGYSPVSANITTLSTNPSSLTIGAVQGPQPTLDPAISLGRFWPITEEGSVTATLTFNYFDSDVSGSESLYRVNRIANGVLDILTSPTATVDTTANTATVTGVTNFSDWTLSATPFPLVISPSSTTIDGGNQVTFTATGGQAGYTFSISQNNSGGSINSTTGVYTAGLTGGVNDTVIVTDSIGTISQATISVIDPFVVINTNDTGVGSLRKALLNASNTPGAQTVSFNIPGPGPYRIKLRTGVSFNDTVTIDGTTQPGYAGAPIIEIDGSELGLIIPSSRLMVVNGPNSTIRGLVFNRLPADSAAGTPTAIELRNSGTVIQNCYIGTDVTGLLDLSLGNGIRIDSDNNIIGGASSSERNVISGNENGISMSGQQGNIIRGNYIGVGIDGVTAIGNERAIIVEGKNNVIGGTEPGQGNVIANSNDGSLGSGVSLRDELPQFPDISYDGNTIRGNSIYNNDRLGIDIQLPFGVTPNDPCDADNGTNDLQNFPVITTATVVGNTVSIQGTLNSIPSRSYDLDFYANDLADPSGHGEGKYYLGSAQVTTDASCNSSFNATLSTTVQPGQLITATATDPSGSTSEFSVAVDASVISVTPITVTNTNDSGPGSLRQAILESNNTPGVELINFAIESGPGPHVITIQSFLPSLLDTVIIDGTTQPGYAGIPLIGIAPAAGFVNAANGIIVRAPNVTIKGLRFGGFPSGVAIGLGSPATNTTIQSNYIGLDFDGVQPLPSAVGITISGASDSLIGGPLPSQRNYIVSKTGISLGAGATNITIVGNFIGTNAAGSVGLNNATDGVDATGIGVFFWGASNNRIGGYGLGEGNLISGNSAVGIGFFDGLTSSNNGNRILGNQIGTDVSGTSTIHNAGFRGILDRTSANTIVGDITPAGGNIIAFHRGPGIEVTGFASGMSIRGNSIFSNGDGDPLFYRLGIELGSFGPNPIDPGDGDPGPNGNQNHPALNSVNGGPTSITVNGSLTSKPNETYMLDFYSSPTCDPSGFGEGRTYLGEGTVNTDASGIAGFSIALPVSVPETHAITATATDSDGNSSEFSRCRFVSSSVISGRSVAGIQMVLTGGQSAIKLTDWLGRYEFVVPNGRSYTITPVKDGLTFAPSSRTFNNLASDQPDQNFFTTLVGFRLSGTVTTQLGGGTFPLAEVALDLSGPATRMITTTTAGTFSTPGLPPSSYTLTPQLDGYTFAPASANVLISTADVTQNFTAATNIPGLSGRIAFESSGTRIANADLSAEVAIGSTWQSPALSRDGQRLAFSRIVTVTANGTTQQRTRLFVANSDGSNPVQFATLNGAWDDTQPAWSPDGNRITFRRIFSFGHHLMSFELQTQTETTLDSTGSVIQTPAWSFDGTQIVYHRVREADPALYTVPSTGGSPTLVTPANFDASAVFSPIDNRIAYIINSISNSVVRVVGAHGGGTIDVSVPERSVDVAWSPNGALLAVSGQTSGKLYFIDSATGAIISALGKRVRRSLSWAVDPALETPVGNNVAVNAGSVGITFGGVAVEGTTTVTPIPSSSAGTVPGGFQLSTMAFEISTTASVSPPIIVCFTVPTTIAFSETQFNALSILHNENGVLVDRTVSRNFATLQICAQVDSLSPFVLAEQVNSALPSITGLVRDSNGDPLPGVEVRLYGTENLLGMTDQDGIFSFVNLTSGGNYIVQPKQVGYLFSEYIETFVGITGAETAVFIGTPGAFTITGRTVNLVGGVPNVTVELEGDASDIRVTDSNGEFSFPGLPADGTYIVRPFSFSYVYQPSQQVVTPLTGDAITTDFFQLAPTAAPVSIGGRILTADGRGIAKAKVTLTGMNGEIRTALTGPFGYYTLDGVSGGQSYILEVSNKRYSFPGSPRLVNANSDVTDADFIGVPIP